MSIGLISLLDDVAGVAKAAAASIDDIAVQAAKAGTKAAGVVIDDAAVSPRYVVGFVAARELPIVWKIAKGSLRNKLLFLLPAALALSLFAASLITPLLMLGGAYLCYEGVEKVFEAFFPDRAHAHETKLASVALNVSTLEDEKVASAIKTDFILSAEIMAIALAAIPEGSFLFRAAVLALVGVGITAAVYGAVALIVKADDVGVALASRPERGALGIVTRALGRSLVIAMPVLLKGLAIVGTAAMIWVGGGIIVHGLEEYGAGVIAQTIHHAAETAAQALPAVAGLVGWATAAAGSGVVGLLVGAALIPVVELVLAPAWRRWGRR